MPRYSLFLMGLIYLLSSCLREQAIPLASDFSVEASEDRTSPVVVQLTNKSYGADEYEWSFEGGEPSTSQEKDPGKVTFAEPGEHKIRLRVRNAIEEQVSEQTIRVDSALSLSFDYEIAVNDIAPALVTLRNRSQGGRRYEWTFEGDEPSTSTSQHPSAITFRAGGEHLIRLKVFNGSRYEELSKTLTLRAPMHADFTWEPSTVDQDWEAPLTLMTKNLTTSALSYHWSCKGATVHSPEAEQTSIRFERAGRYKLMLLARNGKEEQRIDKTLTIKPNRGLLEQRDLKFGIYEARNTIGCFYSASAGAVVTSQRITKEELGSKIELGFFALNSAFNYCYFFTPSEAKANNFSPIAGAQRASFVHQPQKHGITISDAIFEGVKQAKDLDHFRLWQEAKPTHFDHNSLPHFVLFRTGDGRRGLIRIKRYQRAGASSYILADVKLEKRPEE